MANGNTTIDRRGAVSGFETEAAAGGADSVVADAVAWSAGFSAPGGEMAAGQSHHATPPMTSATDGGRGDDDPATPQRPRGQSRARQSGEPFGAHRIGAHRPCDVLDAVLADVVEGVRKLVPDLVSDHSGDANSTGLGECLQPCRDIHTVAEDVVFFDDHIAQIDPNAEPDATLLAHLRFAADHPALNLHSAAHRIHDTRKFRQQTIAGVLDDPAMMLPDLWLD